MGAAESGIAPGSISFLQGVSAKVASSESAPVLGRSIAKLGHDILASSGRKHSAPAAHLRLVSMTKNADWNAGHQDAVDHVIRTLRVLEPLKKQAFSDALGAAGLAARGVGYGSVGLGAGLGALYFLLSRHSNQDSADLESMQRQIDYYNELGKELDDSMRRRYRYNDLSHVQ